MELNRLVVSGRHVSEDLALRLEAKLVRAPDDLEGRLVLIGYWGRVELRDAAAGSIRLAKQEPHVLWLVAHEPSLDLGDSFIGPPYLVTDAVAAAWSRAATEHAGDPAVMWNAASALFQHFHRVEDSPAADDVIDLFERLMQKGPDRAERILRLCATGLGMRGDRSESERRLARCALQCGLDASPSANDELLGRLLWPMLECARIGGDRDDIAALREAIDQGVACSSARLSILRCVSRFFSGPM